MDLNKSLTNFNNNTNHGESSDQSLNIWGSEVNESFLQDLEEPFDPDNENTSQLRNDEQYKGFDNNSGGQYIYPINFSIRTYQFNIVKASLFKNTLIVLPTGLGKTFIAAVVMYNIYRWYPTGKVIFMAPTRPLVSQQIEACCKIMGIPVLDTAEMTGKQNKNKRAEMWHNKRIFFATPQVVQIDINDTELNFPFDKIKLVVVDEAHKAKGRYAYTDVIQTIINRNPYFRIIALSATPGRRIEDVMEVIQNLCISHLEVRSENSIDIHEFTFRKNIKIVLVPLGEQLSRIRDELINIIDPYVRNLIDNGILSGNTGNFTKYWLVMEQKKFREMSMHQRHPKHSTISTDFSICISLYHALELLERHGVRVFLNFFDDPDPEKQKEKFFVQSNSKLRIFLNNLRLEVGPNPFAISDQTMTNGKIHNIPDNLDFGHPKFEMVKKYLVDNFQEHKESKVIVFCEFRESVMLLHRLLLQSRPLILPRIFVGQGGTGSIRAVSQKEQIQVMNDFRNGTANTLLATSVAEEGIDVGEVNLIICFDISSKNPTRFVQRIGRTGRKQHGQVIMLATEGKEHSLVKEVLATKDKVNQKLSKSRSINQMLYKRSPRIVPPEFNPKCLEVFMKVPNEESTQATTKQTKNKNKRKKPETDNIKKSGRRKIKEINSSSQDVRNFFKKIDLNDEPKILPCSPGKESNNNNILPDDDLINVDNIIKDFSPITQFPKRIHFLEPSQIQHINQQSSVTNMNLEPYFRKINHLVRKLDNNPDYINFSNIEETLLSKNVDKNVKKFILRNNVSFVREKFDAMQIIWSLNNNEINTLSGIDNSEKRLRLIYSSIEEVLGNKNAVEKFLQENKDKYFNDVKKIELDEKFSDFFKEFEEREFTDNVQGFMLQKLNEIDFNLLESEQEKVEVGSKFNQTTSMIYESLLENEFNSSMTNYEFDLDFERESKYGNKFTQFNNEIRNQSTPITKKFHNQKIKNVCNENSVQRVQECITEKNYMNISNINSSTKLSSEKSIPLPTKEDAIFKTDWNAPDQLKNYSLNKDNFNSKLISNNLCKKYEISADLFDDDFDEILASNNILNSIENKLNTEMTKCGEHISKVIVSPTKKLNTNNVIQNPKIFNFIKSQFSPSIEKRKPFLKGSPIKISDCVDAENNYKLFREDVALSSQNEVKEHSMPEVDKILEIVVEREDAKKEKHNTSNPELEDFDINDFLEPFEGEGEWKEIQSKENSSPEKVKATISRQYSDDIFDISSPRVSNKNNIQQTKYGVKLKNSKEAQDESILISPSLIGPRRQLKHTIRKTISAPANENENFHISNSGAAKSAPDFKVCDVSNKIVEESIIFRPWRKLKNIIESSESDEENEICQLSQKNTITSVEALSLQRQNKHKKNQRKNRKHCKFLDDEAGHSGNDSDDSDEFHDETDIFDSIVVVNSEEEDDDPNVNMHAKYLQSIRSPKQLVRGAFKIPPQRKFMDLSRIFSQPAQPDDTLNDCSFVVSDEDNVFDGEVSEICPLEQAEAILKARRKAKRKQKEFNVGIHEHKRRRIINEYRELSDNESD